jgi:hypothetical protein
MSAIVSKKRKFYTVDKLEIEKKYEINPSYSKSAAIGSTSRNKYIKVDVEILKPIKRSRIEYIMKCVECDTKFTARRKDAKICSNTCRKAAFDKKKEKNSDASKNDVQVAIDL